MKRIDIFNDKKNAIESNFQLVFSNEGIKEEYYISDKLKICRFCNRSEPEVTFNDVAHAIPESLGNKYVILVNETDRNCHFGFFAVSGQNSVFPPNYDCFRTPNN